MCPNLKCLERREHSSQSVMPVYLFHQDLSENRPQPQNIPFGGGLGGSWTWVDLCCGGCAGCQLHNAKRLFWSKLKSSDPAGNNLRCSGSKSWKWGFWLFIWVELLRLLMDLNALWISLKCMLRRRGYIGIKRELTGLLGWSEKWRISSYHPLHNLIKLSLETS